MDKPVEISMSCSINVDEKTSRYKFEPVFNSIKTIRNKRKITCGLYDTSNYEAGSLSLLIPPPFPQYWSGRGLLAARHAWPIRDHLIIYVNLVRP